MVLMKIINLAKATKMKNIKTIFYFIAIIPLVYSCAPAYTPNMVNTPLFTSEGEFQATIGTGTSGIDPQLAYAIDDHVGIMLNASFANRTDTNYKNFHKHLFAELGVGYFLPLGKTGRFEIFGGGGMGSINAKYENNIFYGRSRALLTRIFIQPSIGISTSAFDGAFTPRFVFVNINNIKSTENSKTFEPFFEPTLTAKVGWKYVKMMYQIGLSFPLVELKNYTNQPFMFSIGLMAKIPTNNTSKNKLVD